MKSPKKIARIAGLFYLIIVVCGAFAELYIRELNIVVPEDAAATAANIVEIEGLFRIALISDLIMMVAYALLGLTFFTLLKKVNRNVALLMVTFNLIGVPIMCLNMVNHFAALHVATGQEYLTAAFSTDQLNALALFFLNLHDYGYIIAQVSTGIWLFPLGYLVYKSAYFPKILGILLAIAAAGYVVDLFAQFLLPEYANTIEVIALAPAAIAEMGLLLWLLIKGVRNQPEQV